ncbi:MAG: type II toxin-antitoxin system PemK/MazF family toxin [Oculatellaceae cyanobacterium bins.114]|nr:type II toxin-antitoxin system PemK/MazF family toxin [Oculatellaceae cyanobacterium bins.114]
MTNYRFGDVILVPFPFTNQATTKKWPAIIVSSEVYHAAKADVILIAVTSQLANSSDFGESAILEWQSAGLLKPSIVKPILATLEVSLVIRTLGHLQEGDRQTLRTVLTAILG